MSSKRNIDDDVQSYIDTLALHFDEGYCEGRQAERKKLLESGWLAIKDIDEVKRAAISPCSKCKYRYSEMKMPCPKKDSCEKLEKQILALNILNYLDK